MHTILFCVSPFQDYTLAEGLNNAAHQRIELAFLDVELYDDNIFNTLAVAGDISFKIVFVTAYQQYAFRAIKTDALDYLLKPMCEDDITACYSKIKRHFQTHPDAANEATSAEGKANKKIIIKNLDKVYVIRFGDIYYMAGNGGYTEITFLFNGDVKSVVICKVLNKIEEEYEHASFFRVHKSYIVNLDKIRNVITAGGMHVKMLDEKIIPVAKRRAHDFLLSLK